MSFSIIAGTTPQIYLTTFPTELSSHFPSNYPFAQVFLGEAIRRMKNTICRMTKIGISFYLILILCACARLPSRDQQGLKCQAPGTLPVPAGWFLMGENDGHTSNQPQRRVYLDAFCIHKTEVTQADFAAFLESRRQPPSDWDPDQLKQKPNFPMVAVRWEQAADYCQWMGMRLPTEAEWEKAARGSDGRRYPWGNDWDQSKANTRESKISNVTNVGSYPDGSSPYGVLDMCGNAIEWVADVYDKEYYFNAPDHNPKGPDLVMDHVLRGGSYDSNADYATTYFRDSSHSAMPNARVGFRCALNLSE